MCWLTCLLARSSSTRKEKTIQKPKSNWIRFLYIKKIIRSINRVFHIFSSCSLYLISFMNSCYIFYMLKYYFVVKSTTTINQPLYHSNRTNNKKKNLNLQRQFKNIWDTKRDWSRDGGIGIGIEIGERGKGIVLLDFFCKEKKGTLILKGYMNTCDIIILVVSLIVYRNWISHKMQAHSNFNFFG